MIRRSCLTFLLLSVVPVAGCLRDETVSAYVDRNALWRLHSVDGAPFAATATLRFAKKGQVTGAGPCNTFTAGQTAPYPWISIGPIAATRRACAELENEQRYFQALAGMTRAEASGDTLILGDDSGRMMEFRSIQP